MTEIHFYFYFYSIIPTLDSKALTTYLKLEEEEDFRFNDIRSGCDLNGFNL